MTTWTKHSYPSTTWTENSYASTLWRINTLLKQGLYPLIKDYLMFWLSFDEESGNLICPCSELEFTASGSPTYQQPDHLGRKKAILFNIETSDCFYHASAASLNIGSAEDLMLFIIAKTSDTGNSMYLIHKIDGSNIGYALYKTGSNDKLTAYIRDDSSQKLTYSDDVINDNEYHLFIMAWDRDDKSHMFIDGSLQTDEDTISAIGDVDNTTRLSISGNAIGNQVWHGHISEAIGIKGSDLSEFMTETFAQQVCDWSEL